jgi:SWI/SNF-related matrix-associated actin-dependent regulator 1 of chromatin subfamily A
MPASGDVHTHVVLKSRHGVFPSTDINAVVTSYELTRNEGIHNALLEKNWDLMILDEAHYLKTTDAERTRAIFGGGLGRYRNKLLANKAGSIVGLTGTPLPNRPRECYTLANALCPESIDWLSYDDFCFRFNPSMRMNKDDKIFNIEKQGRLPELQARLRSNFMVRRLKKEVLKDLPDKRYELNYIEPDGNIQEVLMRESLLNFNVSDLKDPFSSIWGMISTIRKEMGIAKVPRVVEHMKYLLDVVEVPKVVLFAHHVDVMNQLTTELERFGVVAVRGGMSSGAKNNSILTFQNDPSKRIFLGQMDAAGFGIDGLQNVCSHVVFAEPAWVPGTNEQAVDRCHRIGQHGNVLAQFLVVEGSFDEKVLATVFEKNETIFNVLDRSH